MEQNAFFRKDYTFHLAIAKASCFKLFMEYLASLRETITIHQFCSIQQENSLNAVPDSHFRIYNAILSRDAREARQEMHNLLHRTANLIL